VTNKKTSRFAVGTRAAARIEEAARMVPREPVEAVLEVSPEVLSPGDHVVSGYTGAGRPTTKRVSSTRASGLTGSWRIDFEDGSYSLVPPGARVYIPGIKPPSPMEASVPKLTPGYTFTSAPASPPVKKKAKATAKKKAPASKEPAKFEMKGHDMASDDIAKFEFKLSSEEIIKLDKVYVDLMVELEKIATELVAWQSPGHSYYMFRGEAPIGLLEPIMTTLAEAAKRELKVVARTS